MPYTISFNYHVEKIYTHAHTHAHIITTHHFQLKLYIY